MENTDTANALHAARARNSEDDELVAWLRERNTALRTALARTAQQLADAREQLQSREDDTDDTGTDGD